LLHAFFGNGLIFLGVLALLYGVESRTVFVLTESAHDVRRPNQTLWVDFGIVSVAAFLNVRLEVVEIETESIGLRDRVSY
jgi:hypothetical protein